MARIFVWLRYSASRQLTWQRNYNTQPRILGEAQRRLTHAIADVRPSPLYCIPPCLAFVLLLSFVLLKTVRPGGRPLILRTALSVLPSAVGPGICCGPADEVRGATAPPVLPHLYVRALASSVLQSEKLLPVKLL